MSSTCPVFFWRYSHLCKTKWHPSYAHLKFLISCFWLFNRVWCGNHHRKFRKFGYWNHPLPSLLDSVAGACEILGTGMMVPVLTKGSRSSIDAITVIWSWIFWLPIKKHATLVFWLPNKKHQWCTPAFPWSELLENGGWVLLNVVPRKFRMGKSGLRPKQAFIRNCANETKS